jgi:hypothetical protein
MGVSAAIAVAGMLGAGQAAGKKAEKAQREALDRQERAQEYAKAQTASQQRASDMAINRANQATPDITSIMKGAMDSSKRGVASTMLTGTSGVDTSALELGKSTLLGE